ncbi:MAG: TonB-dependent receptor [Bacteroidaceae bacterium]|nr:TonB-dependent receptor [Bacteroidaceae bacterium]
MTKKLALLVLVLLTGTVAFAQSTVKGVVKDPTGEPVIGATVSVDGVNGSGVITDFDGNFSLTMPAGKTQIVVSYVGYLTQKLTAKNGMVITIQEDATGLEEVVVVGYGTMKKSDLSGSSISLGEDAIKGSVITSLDQSLQGRATGVTAVTTSGAPGSASSIRVRGISSINANQEPLYVIDGVIVQGGGQSGSDFGLGDRLGNGKVSTISPLSTINPADIVSMEILKDASATAIYGAQGANGVVLITTKRGKSGEAKFSYDGSIAISRQNKRLDILNLREYAQYYQGYVKEGWVLEKQADKVYMDESILGKGTNWQDAVFRTAIQHSHQVSAQGGSDKVQYYVSGNFMNQQGTIIGSNFRRLSIRTNLDAQLKSWLKLGLSVTYSDTRDDLKRADGEEGIIGYSLNTLPDIPIYNIDGSYATVVREGWTSPNPVALSQLNQYTLNRRKLTGNIFFEVSFLKNLVWHAELGYDLSSSDAETFEPSVDLGGWKKESNEDSWQNNRNTFWQLKNYLTWNQKFAKHSVTAMLGQECWESTWKYQSIKNTGLPTNDVLNPSLGTGTPTIGSGFGSASMASFFARATYNFDERYYLTYTFRYDGSSNFGPKNRWAGFHSVAASWRFSNEAFMKDVKWLSNGKLRFGWGQTGNANIGGYKWGVALSTMYSALGQSYRPSGMPNEKIKWETQEQFDIGLDLGFLDNRINFTFDWYRKESKDMLMMMQLPSYMGTQGNGSSALAAPYGNYGTMRNTGVELDLKTRPVQTKNFSWDSDLQFSFNRNTLVALQGTTSAAIIGYGQWSDVVAMSTVGESMYNFYGYQVEGVYKDFDDILNSPVNTLVSTNTYVTHADGSVSHVTDPTKYNRANTIWPGDLKFKDVNGDGKIDASDKTNIGSPLPNFTFGFTNTFRYKDFDLSIFINGSVGNKVMNYTAMQYSKMTNTWSNQIKDYTVDRAQLAAIDPTKGGNWYEDVTNVYVTNPTTKTPRIAVGNSYNSNISDRYIEDGSYLRIKNISLGYTFPSKILKKIYLTNLRVYANIQNVWTITKYKGYDPEIGASTTDANGYVFGLDNGRYPSPTTFSFGLNVSF